MATSGKKGKKKGVKVNLHDFLADSNTGPIPQVQKKINWSDDVDDEEYSRKSQLILLPTAPRASRCVNEDAVPNHPPFLAFVSNLPYDTNETDVLEFFNGLRIESIKLPREDGESGRLRGFGYIKFETKDDLIEAVRIPDPVIRNRRIRIDLSSDNDQKQMGNNWRARKDNQHDGDGGNRRGFSFRDREKTQTTDDDNPTSWRSQERPKDSPPPQRRNNYGERERDTGFKRRGYDNRDRDNRDSELLERPKLNLTPRTLPIENPLPPPEREDAKILAPKPEAIPSAKIFGDAKPVDTSARERQIEERIEKERQALLAAKAEKEDNEDEIEEEVESVKIENGDDSSWRKRENDDEKHDIKTTSSPTMSRRYSPPRDYKDNRNDRRGPGGSRRDENKRIDRDDRRVGERDDRRDFRQNRDVGRDYNKDFNRNDRDNRNKDFKDKYSKDFNRDRINTDRDRYVQKNPQNRLNRNRNDNRKEQTPLIKDDKEFNEDRMPKYQPQQGPNLEISNKYAILEIDDYECEEI